MDFERVPVVVWERKVLSTGEVRPYQRVVWYDRRVKPQIPPEVVDEVKRKAAASVQYKRICADHRLTPYQLKKILAM